MPPRLGSLLDQTKCVNAVIKANLLDDFAGTMVAVMRILRPIVTDRTPIRPAPPRLQAWQRREFD
jgi:hypothetical protein